MKTAAKVPAIKVDDEVYLTPRTLGCPSAAWKEPHAVVIRIDGFQMTVRLDNGHEVTTHADNVVRRRPEHAPREVHAKPRPPMPPGFEEETLW